ncbi:MAG: hypothetical protein K9H64_17975 [Bacteroidales bacterium]|nr:hypothetical protein [Bacteroidales bacterium]MCF8457922.1 hypothetical protein [Bacteroidales bacterium]
MKKLILSIVFIVFVVLMCFSQGVKNEFDKSLQNGKSVFLVVTDKYAQDTDALIKKANEAKAKVKNVEVIKMDRDEQANADLVSKYQLASAPMPLVLVISSNGVVSGGYTAQQATAELLVSAIPSPKKSEVLKVINEGKSVFIVASSKNMDKKSNLVNTCEQACFEMEKKAKVIEIDLDDPAEKIFMAELKINQQSTEPQTYVVNSKGQVTGNFSGEVNSATLVATATKIASGGCCPPGSGKSCGPTKK